MKAYDVLSYSIDNLVQCFVDGSPLTSPDAVRAKRHRIYFEEYFRALNAATIVAERRYVDKDYLEDYAAYYDRCFTDYPRRTQRLHFFAVAFDENAFKATLLERTVGVGEDALRASYLGFIVVKPLPQTIIGRTCLKTYPSDDGRRQFPSLRSYPVSLFGIELTVESLAFQEQDTVVAACATSAVWSCFQGTGKLFQHIIPPPVEITNWAGDHMPEDLLQASARAFPNSGLTCTQMAHAVRRVGLEPLVIGTPSRYGLNSVVYAYLRGKIPSILAGRLVSDLPLASACIMGGHAIAMTGFSMGGPPVGYGQTGFQLRAARVDKWYCHDDQVGPFARMVWEDIQIQPDQAGIPAPAGPMQNIQVLRTSWDGVIHVNPLYVLLPLYHKIRIPFSHIHDAMLALDASIEVLRDAVLPDVPRAEWDIYLTTASDYKSSARVEYFGLGIDVANSLLVDLPRFVWRVTVRTGEHLQLDFLFDATGIAQHDLLVHVASTNREYAQMIAALSTFPEVRGTVPLQARAILDRFAPVVVSAAPVLPAGTP